MEPSGWTWTRGFRIEPLRTAWLPEHIAPERLYLESVLCLSESDDTRM